MRKELRRMRPSLMGIVATTALMLFAASPQTAAAQGRQQPVQQPVVEVVDLVVESVELVDGELIANVLVTLDILGREVEQLVQVPLEAEGVEAGECDILRLALGPIDLDLLGLVVELDDCDDGPVIVEIDAIAGEGLLGDLLCGIAGGLLGGGNIGDLLGLLPEEELTLVTDGIRDVLNEVLASVLDEGVNNADEHADHGPPNAGTGRPAHAQGGQAADGHRCDILNLEVGELDLNLLGLVVTTSDICLDVYAESGDGNLLGNLLCQVVNLLNGPGNRIGQLQGIVDDILDLLDILDL